MVNTTMGTSHHSLDEKECTRYCHDKGCPHYVERQQGRRTSSSLLIFVEKLYTKNIKLLHNNGMGLSYVEANILIYVILIPFFSAILLWGIIRKGKYG